MKDNTKERLFEMMSKLDKSFTPPQLNEEITKNANGTLVIGIDELKRILLRFQGKGTKFTIDPYDSGRFVTIKDVNNDGILGENGSFYRWEEIYFMENTIMVDMGNQYFYFQLSDEEKAEHPYSQHLEKFADLTDKFNDYEDSLE